MLLNCIVCQMHEQVISLLQVVLLARHANVAFLEVVAFVLGRNHDPQSDIELPLTDQ